MLKTKNWRRVSTVQNKERCWMSGCVIQTIVPELRPRQPSCPLLGMWKIKTAEIYLKTAVDNLWFTIGLQVVCGAAHQCGTLKAEELSPKMAHEDFIAVRHYGLRSTCSRTISFTKTSATVWAVKGWLSLIKWAYLLNLSTTISTVSHPLIWATPQWNSWKLHPKPSLGQVGAEGDPQAATRKIFSVGRLSIWLHTP